MPSLLFPHIPVIQEYNNLKKDPDGEYSLGAQFAGKYSMWSDGFWEINDDGTELTLTPKNQSENGSIGVAAGKSKTFKGQNGVFSVPVTFEQGGKTTIKIDFNKVSK